MTRKGTEMSSRAPALSRPWSRVRPTRSGTSSSCASAARPSRPRERPRCRIIHGWDGRPSPISGPGNPRADRSFSSGWRTCSRAAATTASSPIALRMPAATTATRPDSRRRQLESATPWSRSCARWGSGPAARSQRGRAGGFRCTARTKCGCCSSRFSAAATRARRARVDPGRAFPCQRWRASDPRRQLTEHSSQRGLPQPRVHVGDRETQRGPAAHEDRQLPRARQPRVHEIAEQHAVVLCAQRDDHRGELAVAAWYPPK